MRRALRPGVIFRYTAEDIIVGGVGRFRTWKRIMRGGGWRNKTTPPSESLTQVSLERSKTGPEKLFARVC